MKKLIPLIMLICIGYMVFQTSCANVGMPTGGDKDTIPPEVVRIEPLPNQTNYDKNEITISFNEFVVSTEVSSTMLVSPPLSKNPIVTMKGKTLEIELNDELKDSTTYSIDFRNSIQDNNEGNEMEDFRIAFSTGEQLDSLEIGGFVRNAENMEPMEDILVSLYAIDSLHYFRDSIPNYVAMTDEEGFFLLSNIAEGRYRIYAIEDLDKSYTYNSSEELIGFIDTLISPFQPMVAVHHPDSSLVDTITGMVPDSISEAITSLEVEEQHSHQHVAEPFYLSLYKEDVFNQYLNGSARSRSNFCQFFFDESLSDSFKITAVRPNDAPLSSWSMLEFSDDRDSLTVWLTDTTIASLDTIEFALQYTVLDSMDLPVSQVDTIILSYKEKEQKRKKKKKDEEEEEIQIPHFTISTNAKADFDVYNRLMVSVPEPLESIDSSMVHLYKMEDDTVEVPIEYEFTPDSLDLTRYFVDYPWEYEEIYRFYIDSAAAVNISQRPSNALAQEFNIQEEAYYAKIILELSNVKSPSIVQILESNEDEALVQEKTISSDGTLEFELLHPEKYIIRLIVDDNSNGEWDAGKLDDNRLPEQVVYYPKIIKLRSNFEVQESWTLPDNLISSKKKLVDTEKEEKDKVSRR